MPALELKINFPESSVLPISPSELVTSSRKDALLSVLTMNWHLF